MPQFDFMCGRYSQARTRAEIELEWGEVRIELKKPRFNIAPGQFAPVIRLDDGKPRVDDLRWGLIPGWAKDAKIAFQCINARSETVADKPAYRGAFKSRRCLVPADGFYEWLPRGKVKLPYRFVRPTGGSFVFAGLWESWQPPEAVQPLWSHDFKKDFGIKTPLWGFSGHPLVDGKKLICLAGGDGSVAVAYDKDTGKELWRALTAKEPGYAPPMIHEFGGKRQLILWHPEAVNALDPETGKVFWTHPLTPSVRAGMTIPSPRKVGDLLFLTSFYNGSLLLRVGAETPSVVWQSKKVSEMDTDGLHSVMATPLIEDGHIYSPCSYGQFRCLKLETGERLWETFAPTSGKSTRWGNAFIVKNGGRSFIFSEQGDLIIAKLTPEKYEELGRAHLLDPVNHDPGRPVVWSHPAFANKSIYARNDQEIVSVSLGR